MSDTYMTLPVGRVWHSTDRWYADKECTSAIDEHQSYWLDRKMLSRGGPKVAQEVFLRFETDCLTSQCHTHNGQFAAIMHSIRLMRSISFTP